MKPNIAQKGPYIVELQEGKEYYWCTCGQSKNQPFCDGTHQGSEFSPMNFKAEKSGTHYMCGCKQSKNPPYCDGTHKDL